jgi:hypothetical protein
VSAYVMPSHLRACAPRKIAHRRLPARRSLLAARPAPELTSCWSPTGGEAASGSPIVDHNSSRTRRKRWPQGETVAAAITLDRDAGEARCKGGAYGWEIPPAKQTEQDLLWIRDEFLLHEEDFDKIIVHGHTPSEEPEVLKPHEYCYGRLCDGSAHLPHSAGRSHGRYLTR